MSGAVRPEHRYVRGRRCPICKGADGDPRGAERRCFGFLSRDGEYAHCSREEYAGSIEMAEGSRTYAHRLAGPCQCGTTHSEATTGEASAASGQSSIGRIVAEYNYHDESGALVYQVVRFEPKAFRQRRRDPKDGERWIWNLKGTRRVLYHLDRVIEADPERVVYVGEGEKDVEALEALGLVATCNPQGAGKWGQVADCASKALKGRHVVVIADADDPGRRHAADVEAQLRGVAASVRVIEPRRGKDAAEWIEAGAAVEEIEATAASAAADVANDVQSENTVAPDQLKRWHRMPEFVDVIMSRASEPWARLTVGDEELVSVRAGGNAVVMGPTGGGKTSLVAALAIEHARAIGPVVVMSRELPADEFVARAIGMQCGASWPDVLTGHVPLDDMRRRADLPRVFIAERKDATLHVLVEMIRAAQQEYPGQLVLVVVDYVQIVESKEGDPRAKVSDVIQQIDDILREHRCVGLLISQMSRASSRAARNGEAIGADSIDGGAESAAIERTASVTLSIGQTGPQREDGTCAVDLSIGKGRMTGGDRVVPMSYDGRTGRWRIAGASRSAAEVRDERTAAKSSEAQATAETLMDARAERATAPLTRDELCTAARCKAAIARAGLAAMLERGDLVEVRQKQPRSKFWKLWKPAKAAAAGIPHASEGGSE